MAEDNRPPQPVTSYKKWGLGTAGLLVIVVGVYWIAENYLESYIEDRIQQTGERMTGKRYQFSLEDFQFSLWGGQVGLYGLSLQPTTAGGDSAHIKSGKIDSVQIDQLSLFALLTNGAINIERISVANPELLLQGRVRRNLWEDFRPRSDSTSSGSSNFSTPIEVQHVELSGGRFRLQHPQDSTLEAKIGQLDFDLRDVRLDTAAAPSQPRLQIGGIKLQATDLLTQTYENFYNLHVGNFSVNSDEYTLTVDSLRMEPRYDRYIFAEQNGREIDRISMLIPTIRLIKFEMLKLRDKQLRAQKLLVNDLEMEIFHDKHPPASLKSPKKLPQQAMADLPFAITIDTVSLAEATITYGEHVPQSSIPGEVTFANLNADITGINTDSTRQQDSAASMHLSAETSLLGIAPLRLEGDFERSPDGAHQIQGSLGAMDLTKMNPVLEPLGFVSIDSGNLESLEYSMQLDDQKAQGEVVMKYSDLNIELMEHGELKDDEQKKLISFLANALKIKSKNTEEPLRKGEISFERDPHKSIFNYWWKSLQTGLKGSLGL